MNLGILLWNKCPAQCSHCAVSSGPREEVVLTDADIRRAIDSCFYDDKQPKIGLSGGEAFLYFDRLSAIVEYATRKGAQVSVNTSCSWAHTLDKAVDRLSAIKKAGLRQLVVSTDEFHREYIKEQNVLHVLRACAKIHLECELQYVATKRTERLWEFLRRNSVDLLNITCREIPCHPVGRAEQFAEEDFFRAEGVPQGLCPSAVLSISAAGNIIPCCNTAGHLPALKLGTVKDDLADAHLKFTTSALMQLLCSEGPKALLARAIEDGYQAPELGYVDQCHLCHDLFKDAARAELLKMEAVDIMADKFYRKSLEAAPRCGQAEANSDQIDDAAA